MNLNQAITWARGRYGVNVNKTSNTELVVAYKTPNGKRSFIVAKHDPVTLIGKLTNGYSDPAHRGQGVGTALRAVATWILYLAGYEKIKHQGVNREGLVGPNEYPISTRIMRKHLGFKRYRRNEPAEPSNSYSHKGSPSGEYGYNSVWRVANKSVRKLKTAVRKSVTKLKKRSSP